MVQEYSYQQFNDEINEFTTKPSTICQEWIISGTNDNQMLERRWTAWNMKEKKFLNWIIMVNRV